jgi:hypothetical protein
MTTFQLVAITILLIPTGAGLYFGMSWKEAAEVFLVAAGIVALYAIILLLWSLLGARGAFGISDYLLLTGFHPGALPLWIAYGLAGFALGGLLHPSKDK